MGKEFDELHFFCQEIIPTRFIRSYENNLYNVFFEFFNAHIHITHTRTRETRDVGNETVFWHPSRMTTLATLAFSTGPHMAVELLVISINFYPCFSILIHVFSMSIHPSYLLFTSKCQRKIEPAYLEDLCSSPCSTGF